MTFSAHDCITLDTRGVLVANYSLDFTDGQLAKSYVQSAPPCCVAHTWHLRRRRPISFPFLRKVFDEVVLTDHRGAFVWWPPSLSSLSTRLLVIVFPTALKVLSHVMQCYVLRCMHRTYSYARHRTHNYDYCLPTLGIRSKMCACEGQYMISRGVG